MGFSFAAPGKCCEGVKACPRFQKTRAEHDLDHKDHSPNWDYAGHYRCAGYTQGKMSPSTSWFVIMGGRDLAGGIFQLIQGPE